MKAARQNQEDALSEALELLCPGEDQKSFGSSSREASSSEVFCALHLLYTDHKTGVVQQVSSQEEFEKTELFSTLNLLYLEDKSLLTPPSMDEVYEGLSKLDRQVEENPDNLAAFPEELQALLLRVADRVRDLRNSNIEHLPPPEANEIEEHWNTRDKSLKESPLEFVQRVYATWVGRGLTRGHLRQIDPKLYMALENWGRRGNLIPENILPPMRKRREDANVSAEDIEIYKKVAALKASRRII